MPTPCIYDNQLIVSTENNGTRMFRFADAARIDTEPTAVNNRLRPDMSTGIVVGDYFYCVDRFLYCLDLADGLNEVWRLRDPASETMQLCSRPKTAC